jgi:hypothetical protein
MAPNGCGGKDDWEIDQLKLEIELLEGMIRKNDPVADAFAAMKTGGDSRQTEKARKQNKAPALRSGLLFRYG